jgi:amidase
MVFGAPMGVSFFGTAFSEPTLIKLASGFEAVTQVRKHNLPTLAQTVPFDHIAGTTLQPQQNRMMPGGNSLSYPPASNRSRPSEKEHRRPHHL